MIFADLSCASHHLAVCYRLGPSREGVAGDE